MVEHQNTNWLRKSVFFLLDVLMTVDDAMVINAPSGLIGIRNMGLAKQATPSAKLPRSPTAKFTQISANFAVLYVCMHIAHWHRHARSDGINPPRSWRCLSRQFFLAAYYSFYDRGLIFYTSYPLSFVHKVCKWNVSMTFGC